MVGVLKNLKGPEKTLTSIEIQYSRIWAGRLKESWGSKWPRLLRSLGGKGPRDWH